MPDASTQTLAYPRPFDLRPLQELDLRPFQEPDLNPCICDDCNPSDAESEVENETSVVNKAEVEGFDVAEESAFDKWMLEEEQQVVYDGGRTMEIIRTHDHLFCSCSYCDSVRTSIKRFNEEYN